MPASALVCQHGSVRCAGLVLSPGGTVVTRWLGLSGECFQACGSFPVAVHRHQVDAVEGAAVAETGDLLPCGLDAGHLVVRDLAGEPAGDFDVGMVAARRWAMAALASTITPA